MAAAMAGYLADGDRLRAHGAAARRRAESRYGIDTMLRNYQQLYDGLLAAS
jgi:glycosyltransferase involved in cell wall biosynthesis